LIVLGFPVLDFLATLRFAQLTGVPAPIWFLASAVAGFMVLRQERVSFRARTLAALHGDRSLLRDVVDSGRKVLAGFLLIVPGVLSDVIALVLLALPINVGNPFAMQTVPNGQRNAFNGDYRRLD